MAAILKLRRGTSASPSLVESELFYNTSLSTLQVGKSSGAITLVKLDESNSGNLVIVGTISGSDLSLTGDVTANNAHFSGDVRLDGQLYLGDVPTDNVNVNAQFSGSLIPNTANTFDLGSQTSNWRNIYAQNINGSIVDSNLLHFTQSTNAFTASQEAKNNTIGLYTASIDSKFTTLASYTGSINSDLVSLHSFTASQETKNSTLATYTGSINTKFSTLGTYTGSVNNQLTELYSTASNHESRIVYLSGSFSQSVDNRLDQLEANSGSVNNSVSLLNVFTSSQNTKNSTLGTYTGSVNNQLTELYSTASNHETRINGIQSYTSSLKTAIGVSGTDVTINGNLHVQGTTTTIDSTTISIGDNIIELNGSGVTNAGLLVKDATNPNTASGSLIWNSTNDYWSAGTWGNESRILLAGGDNIVSGSAQVVDSLKFTFLEINGDSVVSGSSQIDATQTTNFATGIKTQLNNNTVISGSSQVNADTIANFDSNVKDKLNADGVVSGSAQVVNDLKFTFLEINGDSVVSGSSQIDLTATTNYISGIKTQLDANTLVSGSSQLTSSYDLRYANSASFHNLVGAWDFGTQGSIRDAAFYSVTSSADIVLVSGSINYTNNHLLTAGATKKYIDWRTDEILTAIGAADITAVISGDGLTGGGITGDITMSLDTASAHFMGGVKSKLNADGVISSSYQIVSILQPLNTFSASQETKNTTLATYTGSVNNQLTELYGTASNHETRVHNLEIFSSSINTSYEQIASGTHTLISGSRQLDGKFIDNLSGSFTGSFKGNLAGTATYSDTTKLLNSNANSDYSLVFTTSGSNGYLTQYTDGLSNLLYNPSTNRLKSDYIQGTIEATNGVISGSSQITSSFDGRYLQTGSFNTYTASQDTKNSTLATYTGSIDTKFTTLATYTGSVDSSLSQLNAVSHSHSNKTQLDTINQNLSTTSDVNFGTIHTSGTGSIGTNLTVYGNLTVFGTQSIINSQNLEVNDNLIYLAPTASGDWDLGIVGHYNDGTYAHAGIFTDASDGHAWKVFKGLTAEVSGSVDTSHPSFTLADFKAANFTGTSFTGTINATNGIVSGSSQITLSSTTGGGTSANVQFGSLGIGMAASGTTGRIDATNDIVAYSSSDRRFKENITPIENALDKINQIGGYEFDWKEENKSEHGYEGHDLGVIAQEIEAIAPELVQTRENGYKAVKYDKLVSVLIQAVKELSAKVTELENK